jgi:hypothetical protein
MQMNSSTPPVTQPGPNSGHKAFFFSAAALFLQFRALFSFRRSEDKFVPLWRRYFGSKLQESTPSIINQTTNKQKGEITMATEKKKEKVKVRDMQPSKDAKGGSGGRSAVAIVPPPVPSPRARG